MIFSLKILQNYSTEFSCFFWFINHLGICTATNWCPTKRMSAAKAQKPPLCVWWPPRYKMDKYCGISTISLKKSRLYPQSEMMSSYERQSFNLPILWHKEPRRTMCKKSLWGNRICFISLFFFRSTTQQQSTHTGG